LRAARDGRSTCFCYDFATIRGAHLMRDLLTAYLVTPLLNTYNRPSRLCGVVVFLMIRQDLELASCPKPQKKKYKKEPSIHGIS
jgi:hypothetical protein